MTADLLIKGFFALTFGGMFAWIVFDRDHVGNRNSGRQRYQPYIFGGILPLCILTFAVCGLMFYDSRTAVRMTMEFYFGVFLHICLYYLLLMPALPFLRRHISARACAVLWVLPNYLYVTSLSCMQLREPLWVIEAPSVLVWVLLIVWFAGLLLVLGWKIFSHLAFRSRILKDAVPITDPSMQEIWRQEVEAARFRDPKFIPVISPAVRTPLSVGLFRSAVRVVLPERSYSHEELSLIFRHELIHIGREDVWNKFFLVFCTAMCWFNPLMWIAMRKSAEDLELSCDETVLLDSDDDTKRRYADLLLRTAGDERGFTTCLSASASALRYRLKSIIEPGKKHSGALMVGLVFFLLCMSCGYVALAYGETTGREVIYQSREPEEYTLFHARWGGTYYGDALISADEAFLYQYLSSLRMKHIGGNYTFSQEGTSLILMFDTPEGSMGVTLFDRFMKLIPLYGRLGSEYYYLPDGVDWDLLSKCIIEAPSLHVCVTEADDGIVGAEIYASLWRVSLAEGEEILNEMDADGPPDGIYGIPASQATLSFSLPMYGNCEAEIVPLDGGSSQVVPLDGQSMILSLPKEPSLYLVREKVWGKDGTLYQVEFQFEIDNLCMGKDLM